MLPGRRCAECGKLSVEAALCRFCGAPGGTPVDLSGRGRLISWTVIRVAPGRYASEAPYTIGLVELDEGARLTARIEGDADRLAAGQALTGGASDPARGPVFQPG
jgi:uncharacterized OB-fold protein